MPRRPNRDFDELVKYVQSRGFKPETAIDVGVCYGTAELIDNLPDAYHILIEPVAELEDRMKAILKRVRGEYHMVALSDSAGWMPLAVPEGAVEGSTLAVGKSAKTRSVKIETLDSLFADRNLPGPILLKTDCQGFDLSVMKGGIEFLKQVDLIVMEVNMFHPTGDVALPDFGEIVTWMREYGFSVYDIISYQVRPFDDALGYVDLAFVKTDGTFRRHHRWA